MSRPPELRASFDEIVVDSFAGGGGASLGISWALGRGPDIAINHDAEAIALHKANHPETKHYVEDVWRVDPVEATAGRPVGLLWASPDCTHHSKARGGKPRKKKIRGLAWSVVRWAAAVKPRVIVLENVEEFQDWGPLGPDDKPIRAQAGKTFRAFKRKLERLGYKVEHRPMRASHYLLPTIRKRLFLIARCDGLPIVWPSVNNQPTYLWEGRRVTADCIQWELGMPQSIFDRKRPLADKTLARIARGMGKFVIDSPRPFVLNMANGGKLEPIDRPLSTIMTERGGCRALVAPTLIQTGYGERQGQKPRSLDLHKPIGTLVSGQKHALIAAFLAKHFTERKAGEVMGASLFDPTPTVTTVDHNALVAAFMVEPGQRHGGGTNSAAEPMTTVMAKDRRALVAAFLVAYFGNEKDGGSLFDACRTITSKDRFGLIVVEGVEYEIADIGMRMLQPRELYRAQGFPDSYKIDIEHNGKPLPKTAQVRMVGNSVVPGMARAIVAANYQPIVARSEAA